MHPLLTSFRALAALTALTGVAYPLLVWVFAQTFAAHQANGSLQRRDGVVVGSSLLAQKTTSSRYFHPRPSATDFSTLPSGASNLSWTSSQLSSAIRDRREALSAASASAGARLQNAHSAQHGMSPSSARYGDIPSDLLTCSGSGLDPEISPEAAALQLPRIAAARRLGAEQRIRLRTLVADNVAGGLLSPARVNVLALNLALDIHFPSP